MRGERLSNSTILSEVKTDDRKSQITNEVIPKIFSVSSGKGAITSHSPTSPPDSDDSKGKISPVLSTVKISPVASFRGSPLIFSHAPQSFKGSPLISQQMGSKDSPFFSRQSDKDGSENYSEENHLPISGKFEKTRINRTQSEKNAAGVVTRRGSRLAQTHKGSKLGQSHSNLLKKMSQRRQSSMICIYIYI
jgi:hypothetical protein